MPQEPRPDREQTQPSEGLADATPEELPGQWRQRAGFSMFVDVPADGGQDGTWRTRIYHEESGEEIALEGTEASGWLSWILQRIDLNRGEPFSAMSAEEAPSRERSPAPNDTTTAGPVTLVLSGLRVFEAPERRDDSSGHRIRVEAELTIKGLAEAERSLGAAFVRMALLDYTS